MDSDIATTALNAGLEVSVGLTIAWALLLATAIFIYVVLDGFDLGLGILYPFFPARADRDLLMNSVAPVWDGNETWLVLGVGGLFAAFPLAYAIIMPALYPFETMILGLRTYVHAPHLGMFDGLEGADGGSAVVREHLTNLQRTLSSFAELDGAEEIPLRWVVVGEGVNGEPQLEWPGDERPTGDPSCLVIDPADAPGVFDRLVGITDPVWTWVRFGDSTYAVTIRPLLPHESGCGPVQEQIRRFEAYDATIDLSAQE